MDVGDFVNMGAGVYFLDVKFSQFQGVHFSSCTLFCSRECVGNMIMCEHAQCNEFPPYFKYVPFVIYLL